MPYLVARTRGKGDHAEAQCHSGIAPCSMHREPQHAGRRAKGDAHCARPYEGAVMRRERGSGLRGATHIDPHGVVACKAGAGEGDRGAGMARIAGEPQRGLERQHVERGAGRAPALGAHGGHLQRTACTGRDREGRGGAQRAPVVGGRSAHERVAQEQVHGLPGNEALPAHRDGALGQRAIRTQQHVWRHSPFHKRHGDDVPVGPLHNKGVVACSSDRDA